MWKIYNLFQVDPIRQIPSRKKSKGYGITTWVNPISLWHIPINAMFGNLEGEESRWEWRKGNERGGEWLPIPHLDVLKIKGQGE